MLINNAMGMKGTKAQALARRLRDRGLYNNDASVGELYVQMVRDGGDMGFMLEGTEVTRSGNAPETATVDKALSGDYNETNAPKAPKEFIDDPFDEGGYLKLNVRYQSGEFGYYYETDDFGRICFWRIDNLRLTEREGRLRHNPNTPGKLEGDHPGHLVGDRFGGSPNLDNLVSQSQNVNLSEYRILENHWAKAISEGKQVSVSVDIKYDGDGLRPVGFDVKYKIDGEAFSKIIRN